jgi:hypothetical protein
LNWISTSNGSFNTAANWSTGTAPANGDTLIFNSLGTASVTNNLTTSLTGITLYVDQSFTGQIGVVSASARTPLTLLGGTVYVGRDPTGDGTGCPLAYIASTGTNSLTATVLATAQTGAVSGYAPFIVEGANLTVNATGGTTAVAPIAGTTTTAGLINATQGSGSDTGPTVTLGSGVTATTITGSGANIINYSDNATTSMVASNGTNILLLGTGAVTTMTIGSNSTIRHWGGGNVTTLNNAGTFDRTGDTRNITISTVNAEAGSTFNLDNGKASSTTRSSITLSNCGMQDLTITTPVGERF